MFVSDPLSDMLTRIRNGQHAGKKSVDSPSSTARLAVLEVLKREGYIRSFQEKENKEGFKIISIELKYADGVPVISMLRRISKPGRRSYSSMKDLGTVRSGLGVKILSTSKGVVSDIEARALGVGGEIICEVF